LSNIPVQYKKAGDTLVSGIVERSGKLLAIAGELGCDNIVIESRDTRVCIMRKKDSNAQV